MSEYNYNHAMLRLLRIEKNEGRLRKNNYDNIWGKKDRHIK